MSESIAGRGETTITLCPGGPMLVRGPVSIVDGNGAVLPAKRSTIALCRCGKTSIAPYCDGTHKLLHRPPDRQSSQS